MATLELLKRPAFTQEAQNAPGLVILRSAAYVTLLIQANETDAALWPPEMQHGAVALARLRQMERDSSDHHGAFDWAQLPLEQQDEYDHLSALLDDLQDDGERLPLSELMPTPVDVAA
ncbi:MAG: hypothetical protein M3Y28_05040 [Armatimonadota bacterium]|nr:hypothetical protein [Armatimonadota bacterium]